MGGVGGLGGLGGIQGVIGSGFLPTNIAGLIWWLDANAITGLSADDPVSTWADRSVNGDDFTASGGVRPLYRTSSQNGLPGVDFDGSDDSMTNASASVTSGPRTLFMCVNPDNTTGVDQYYIDIQTGRFILAHLTNSNPNSGWYDGSWRSVASGTTSAQVLTFVVPGSGGELFRDGTSLGTADVTERALGGTIGLGSNYTGTANFAGLIFEWFMYDTAVSVGVQQSAEAYLRNKWGTP